MSLRLLSSGLVALGLALLIVPTAQAQFPRNRMQNMQPIKTGGRLVQTTQDRIQISTNTNEKIVVMVGPETEVSVSGTAEQDYLKSGVTVEFVAEVDKAHVIKEKIVKLLVVTPTSERPVGLSAPEFATPDKKSEKNGGEKAEPMPGDAGVGDAPPAKGRKAEGYRRLRRRSVGQQVRQNAEQHPAVSRHIHDPGNGQVVQGSQDPGFGRSHLRPG